MKRKKILLISSILIILLSLNIPSLTNPLQAFSDTQLNQDDDGQSSSVQFTTRQSLPEGSLDNPSYYLISVDKQEVILAQDETLQRPPASTVKLLTGLVAMESLREDDVVIVGQEVVMENSTMGLQPGDTILVKDLLTALFLPSANDAAVALAIAAKGSVPDFIEAMNQYALKLGVNSSRFQTANGLPALDQFSTAQDLSKIALHFIKNESLMQYVEKEEGKVEWTTSNGLKKRVTVYNTNQLLSVYPGVQGLKTGTTTEAGQCLITYIQRPDGDLILVLLGSENRYKDTTDLLDQGMAAIRTQAALRNLGSSPESMIQAPGFFQ